ncbi:uncharacterized protein SPSK_04946 [Sporothrix schenckii 1099-18]|uniref:Uncharacterized protein n=1 Tax=Sporothrix schenckii 1099-18 TaxID=1397361 RepID=A0A0F2LTF0_SPOSC|nr:uncharacterized protein SPSK_04946 [Sporothrix schenckii 1099-18]KJR80757.1 hypothetical protein SPSK_04946 [Sporothrix schenckii 1099-18]
MDHERERDRLVAALRLKLTQLDARVVAYRRERADEFRRYAIDLLTHVADEAVVAAVADAIEGSPDGDLKSATDGKVAQSYPALYAGFLDNAGDDAGDHNRSILAPPPLARSLPRRSASPPPVLYHTSGVPKEGPTRPPTGPAEASPSLRAHDDDFRGVFTPSFLPLLDSWSYDRRSSDANTQRDQTETARGSTAVAEDSATPEAATAKAEADDEATEATAAGTVATGAAAAAIPPQPSTPVSEPKLRSALRRTSSYSSSRSSTRSNTPTFNMPTNADSPSDTRHVRFSFNGEEVLPTSSPPRDHEQDLSWLMHDDRSGQGAGHSMSVYDYSRHYQNAAAGSNAFSSGLGSAHGSLGLGATALSTPLSHSSLPGNEAETGAAGPAFESASSSALSAGDQTTPPSQGFGAQSENESHPGDNASSYSSVSSPFSSSSTSHQPPTSPPQPRRRHSQILDDDEEEFVPLSRKVSSSDRLRALSKMSLEDPASWTVVDPQADAAAAEAAAAAAAAGSNSAGSSAHASDAELSAATEANRTLAYRPAELQREQAPSPPTVEQREYAPSSSYGNGAGAHNRYNSYNGYNSESSSDGDDGFIAMRASRGKTARPLAPAASTAPASTTTANGTAPESSRGNSTRPRHSTSPNEAVQVTYAAPNGASRKNAVAAEDDDFFGFEPDDVNGEDDDGAVGYPLARVTDVNTRFGEEEEDEDAEDERAEDEEANDDGTVEHQGDDAPVVNDKDLVQAEKTALGIGTDGLDSNHLAFNRSKPIANRDGGDGESALASSLSAARRNGQLDGESGPEPPSSPGPAPISVGSYRGKPIDLFNVVKDPRVLQQAAQMGALNSIYGSIHDHEPHAPANMAEFSSLSGREQLNLLSGTPRSLTERMIMDDTRAIFSPPKR